MSSWISSISVGISISSSIKPFEAVVGSFSVRDVKSVHALVFLRFHRDTLGRQCNPCEVQLLTKHTRVWSLLVSIPAKFGAPGKVDGIHVANAAQKLWEGKCNKHMYANAIQYLLRWQMLIFSYFDELSCIVTSHKACWFLPSSRHSDNAYYLSLQLLVDLSWYRCSEVPKLSQNKCWECNRRTIVYSTGFG